MKNGRVYLAGPVTGSSYDNATTWRSDATVALKEFGVEAVSPLRGHDYLIGQASIADSFSDHALTTQRAVYVRDKFDCHRADLLIVNVLGATRVSIGTMMEVAWAAHNNTPIVLIMEDEGNIHDHSFVRESCAFRVNNLDDAIATVVAILVPR